VKFVKLAQKMLSISHFALILHLAFAIITYGFMFPDLGVVGFIFDSVKGDQS